MKKSMIVISAILMLFCLLSCDQKISHAEHVWGETVLKVKTRV